MLAKDYWKSVSFWCGYDRNSTAYFCGLHNRDQPRNIRNTEIRKSSLASRLSSRMHHCDSAAGDNCGERLGPMSSWCDAVQRVEWATSRRDWQPLIAASVPVDALTVSRYDKFVFQHSSTVETWLWRSRRPCSCPSVTVLVYRTSPPGWSMDHLECGPPNR